MLTNNWFCTSHDQPVTNIFFWSSLERGTISAQLAREENRPTVGFPSGALGQPLPKELSPRRSHFDEAAGQPLAFHHGRHGGQPVAFHQPAGHAGGSSAFPRRNNDAEPVMSAASHGTPASVHHETNQEAEKSGKKNSEIQTTPEFLWFCCTYVTNDVCQRSAVSRRTHLEKAFLPREAPNHATVSY